MIGDQIDLLGSFNYLSIHEQFIPLISKAWNCNNRLDGVKRVGRNLNRLIKG